MDFRKWLAFGTGVGVEVREQELQVTIVRVRRSETAVWDRPRFRITRPGPLRSGELSSQPSSEN